MFAAFVRLCFGCYILCHFYGETRNLKSCQNGKMDGKIRTDGACAMSQSRFKHLRFRTAGKLKEIIISHNKDG